MAGLGIFTDAVNTIARAISDEYAEAEAERGRDRNDQITAPDIVGFQARSNIKEIEDTRKKEKILTVSALAIGAISLFVLSR